MGVGHDDLRGGLFVSVGRIAGAAEFIRTPESAAVFFKLALETKDFGFLLRALEVLAHSKGMADALAWAGLPSDLPRRVAETDGPPRQQSLGDLARCLGARLDVPAAG
jgi:DNA-binding phage protein